MSEKTCWYTGEVCPECGQPEATDGRQTWCSNPDCIVGLRPTKEGA